VATVDDAVHHGRITACLRLLQRDAGSFRFEVLQGGVSGAATYRVSLENEQIVLKVAGEGAPSYVLERARRELRFYRELAGRIPLRVPELLGVAEAAGPCLALRAYSPVPPIETWTEEHYLDIAKQLSRFHALFWNRTDQLARLPWLRVHRWRPDSALMERAAAAWRHLANDPDRQRILTPDEIGWIKEAMRHLDRAVAILEAFPATLCHGDCHHGNLLVDGDGLWRWADWQEVGIGPGPEDLSFFFQRARMAGGSVPEEAAVTSYHHALATATGQNIELSALRRVLCASELRSLLLLWPPFLSSVPLERLEWVVHRLQYLAATLGMPPRH
jgi:Ser/Thr protein kinase RdoA (MazF antagonist)